MADIYRLAGGSDKQKSELDDQEQREEVAG
jgi:hypothetical protein